MTINDKQDVIIEEFELFSDWMDKYENIIDIGKELPIIDPKYKVAENLIKGCQSNVWLQPEFKNGLISFTADSDAIITKGLISMMIRVLSGHTPQQILDADIYFIDKIGLQTHLSPTRSNGLLSMLKQMKMYAAAYHSQV
jgi:cysteine desulfuration protein SufE